MNRIYVKILMIILLYSIVASYPDFCIKHYFQKEMLVLYNRRISAAI